MDKRKIFYGLPVGIRYLLRYFYYLPSDIWDSITGSRGEMIPPKGKIFTGGGDFVETGDRFLKYFIEYGKLKPNYNVLDIGSGVGRMAIPLTKYLSEVEGKYSGIDVVEKGVTWCKDNITSRYPNFQFHYVDLSNDLYKDSGHKSTSFIFPYADNTFEFIFLISVFTHMLPDEVHHYLKEMYRVLKPGHRCFFTLFSYDDNPVSLRNDFTFPYKYDNYALMDDKVKAANVSFKYNELTHVIESIGFQVEIFNKGTWQNKNSSSLDFQDVLVIKK